MVRSEDVRRNEHMSASFMLRPDRRAWRAAALVVPIVGLGLARSRAVRRGLAAAATVEAVAALAFRWHNGPSGLRRRGLPPGRLQLPLYQAFLDPAHYRNGWERHGPVFTTNLFEPTVAIGGLPRIAAVLRRYRHELEPIVMRHSEHVAGGAVRNQTGERHRHTRAALARGFAGPSIEPARSVVDAAVRRHLAAWAADPAHAAPEGRDVRDRVGDLVLDVWITLFFGVDPEADPERHQRLVRLVGGYDLSGNHPREPAGRDEQLALVADAARCPAHLAPSAVRTLAERQPESLHDPVVVQNLVHVLDTTRQDARGLYTWLTYRLAHEPGWCDRIHAASDDTPAAWAVSETLRLHQSESLMRRARVPIEVEGHRVPAGWLVRGLVRDSHRHPEAFADPERFDPSRFAGAPPGPDRYAPFGLDGHACVGEAMARMVGTALAVGLCRGYRLDVTADGPTMFSEYYFWAPSTAFRVRLTPR